MQWFSSKKNPAARYLPDVFSSDEQHFAYRLLSSAAVKTDNRATSTGAIVIDGKIAFVSSEQEAILETLRKLPDGLTLAQRMYELDFAVENHRGLKPNKAYKWVKGKKLNQAAFDAWWRTSAKLNKSQRNIAVDKFMKENLSDMYLTKIRPRTKCLYSAASRFTRSLSAVAQSVFLMSSSILLAIS